MKTKSTPVRLTLILVLVACVAGLALSVGLVHRVADRRAGVAQLRADADAAFAEIDRINGEKLAVQSQVKDASERLREAKLSLSESTEKIATLHTQISELNERLPQLTAQAEEAERRAADLHKATTRLLADTAAYQQTMDAAGDAAAQLHAAMDSLTALMQEE